MDKILSDVHSSPEEMIGAGWEENQRRHVGVGERNELVDLTAPTQSLLAIGEYG